ncbi:MAG: sugar phosphate isomerase/epimerase [Phycisphaerales bacterium]|nr:sugar phosphate isomerase/epimerase [Phycisphaerales bacterium]
MAALATIAPFGFDFDPARLLAAYRALGCTACQFYRNEAKPPTVREALDAAAAGGLIFDSVHGVFGFDYDPSSPDPSERARCLDVYEQEAELCLQLGGNMVVVHPSKWTPERRPLARAEAEAHAAQRYPLLDDFLERLAAVADRVGVTFLIENQPMNCYVGNDPAQLARHVIAAGSTRIRMCLDTGHAHITGDVVEALNDAGPAISYLHMHDNDRTVDDHRMPGDGTIDWRGAASVIRRALPRATRMLEIFYPVERVEALAAAGGGEKLRQSVGM